MKLVNIKHERKCAFCKYWYDPMNSAINPKNTVAGFWEYDEKIKNKCLKSNLEKASWVSCSEYVCKI